MDKSGYIWLLVAAGFALMEAVVPGGVMGWLATGSVAAFIAAAFRGSIAVQVAAFIAATVLTAAVTLPFIRRLHKKAPVPTNADRIIGSECFVREEINNSENRGAVVCDGLVWSARSTDGSEIEKDSVVRVCSIEGVKAIVEKTEIIREDKKTEEN